MNTLVSPEKPRGFIDRTGAQADAERRIAALRPAGESEKGFRARTLIGTPEEVAEKLQHFIDAGVQAFVVSFWDVDRITPLEVLMREVAPKLGALPSVPAAR